MDARSPLPFYMSPSTSPGGKFGQHQQSPLMNILRFFTCRNGFRIRGEKYLAILTLLIFLFICYCCFVYLPDGPEEMEGRKPAGTGRRIGHALKNIFKNIPQPDEEFVLPRPKFYGAKYNKSLLRHDAHEHLDREDPHLVQDREKFRKIVDEHKIGQIPKPKSDQELQQLDKEKAAGVVKSEFEIPPVKKSERENEFRRDTIKNMTMWAWDNYRKYAWGNNELKPISKLPHQSSVFGASMLGATLVDGLDTLYIMGLLDRFEEGRKWVEMSFNFGQGHGDLSVFETTIRFVGGFLSCFALTGDKLFKDKAEEVAKLLLPAFDTPTGVPYALINMQTHVAKNYGWASGGASILSEFGTLNLEFDYLSVITGDPTYTNKMKKIRELLYTLDKENDFYMNYLNPRTGKWGSRHVSLGALGDSFYEYLLKSWLITNKRDIEGLLMYEKAMQAFKNKLFFKSEKDGLFYVAEMKGSRIDHKVDHLACFAGGMFALYAVNSNNSTVRHYWLEKAEDLAHTCHESYIRTETHLGPESFRFTNEFSAITINEREKYYILRPEVLETWFYLWRLTKKQKYRDWAWDAAQSIEKHCKTDAGYSGIRNVYESSPSKDDVQQSFFLAETLKYFYLIFSPDDVIPLEKWVFNTEAHPFPIRFEDSDHAPAFAPAAKNNNVNNNLDNNDNKLEAM